MKESTHDIPAMSVLGVRVHLVQMPEILGITEGWIRERTRCHYIAATGMHGVMEAGRDPQFKTILNSADLFVADGFSLVWLARRRGFRFDKRVCGADLMSEFCELANEKGYKVFFYGDTWDTLNRLYSKLTQDFPNLNIAGMHSPPFRPMTLEEDQEEIKKINESGADIIWVGLGLPKQEQWMFDHRHDLNVPVAVGVGAAFKFMSGQVARAPAWMGDRGFEWLWRFAHEPRRVWRRVLIDGPYFAGRVMLELAGLKRYD